MKEMMEGIAHLDMIMRYNAMHLSRVLLKKGSQATILFVFTFHKKDAGEPEPEEEKPLYRPKGKNSIRSQDS